MERCGRILSVCFTSSSSGVSGAALCCRATLTVLSYTPKFQCNAVRLILTLKILADSGSGAVLLVRSLLLVVHTQLNVIPCEASIDPHRLTLGHHYYYC